MLYAYLVITLPILFDLILNCFMDSFLTTTPGLKTLAQNMSRDR